MICRCNWQAVRIMPGPIMTSPITTSLYPRQNVETGFWLESDRMLSLDFSGRSLEVQRGVVMEEFKQRCLNQPYGDVGHLLRPLAYRTHTYQWPTIGERFVAYSQCDTGRSESILLPFLCPEQCNLGCNGEYCF